MIKGILCDVHGVLYIYPRAIPGSVGAVKRLRKADFPHVFLTNTSQHPKSWVLSSLNQAGFDIEPLRLMTAVEAAGDFVAQQGFERVGWLCPAGLVEDMPHAEVVSPESPGSRPVDVVLVGDLQARFTYQVLNQAFRWLNEGAKLVAIARNQCYQTQDGLVLDSGPFVTLLEDAADVTAHVVGKPNPSFFEAGLRRLGLGAADTGMIGDDFEGDVGPAMKLGMHGIQVKTGKYRERDGEREQKPDAIAPDLAGAVAALLGEN